MNYQETLEFIHSTDWKGSRLGLDRMREMMHRLGIPRIGSGLSTWPEPMERAPPVPCSLPF